MLKYLEILVAGLLFLTAGSQMMWAHDKLELARSAPATRLTITIPEEVAFRIKLPLKISLFYEKDEETRSTTSAAFIFLLFDEDGNQVARDPFYREALPLNVPLAGKEPTYEPKLSFDPYCKELVIGKRYQIICFQLGSNRAASAWFKLVE